MKTAPEWMSQTSCIIAGMFLAVVAGYLAPNRPNFGLCIYVLAFFLVTYLDDLQRSRLKKYDVDEAVDEYLRSHGASDEHPSSGGPLYR